MKPVDDFFASVTHLPSMPKVVQEVLQLLNQQDLTLSNLAHKVSHDPVISAKVLRLANSSYYGASRSIKTVDDAIAMIGLSHLQTMVVASGVTSTFTKIQGLDLPKFWRHSLVTASVSSELAKHFEKNIEVAYVAGLMHNIGELLIHIVFPTGAAEVETVCHGACVEERQAVEHTTMGIDHCLIGEELAKRWNFPNEIHRVIRYYATPLDKDACDIAPLVYMAAHIAFGLEHGEDAKHIAETFNQNVAAKLNVDRIEWIDRIEGYRQFVAQAESFIA